MQITYTMDWVDDWLEGLVHRAAGADATERFRHERFIVSRTVATLATLAALPPYLIARGAPTALEALSFLVLLAPLAAVLITSRTGRLDGAQALVSLALTVFAAGAGAAFGGASTLAVLALAVVPLDALVSGSRRGFLASLVLAGLGIPLMLVAEASGAAAGRPVALAAVFAVGFAVALGHAVAVALADRRLKGHLKAALKAGEAREGVALQTMDDLVTWHDHTGGVLKANTPGAKTLGAGPQQLQGRGLFNRIHVADRPAYLKALSDAAAGQEPVTVQFRVARGESPDPGFDRKPVLVRLGGRKGADRGAPDLVWMEMRAHRLRVPGEDGSSVVAVTRSIAAHKQQADELEALHRKAQHATEERARLLATVSHELRTPLTAIIGYADMLRSGLGTGPRAEDYAGIIHHSGEHMLGLVSSLLNLCAIEAGGRDLEPEPVDVAALIEDCCRTLSLGAERAGIAIDRVVPGHLPEMWADRQACEQILLNLLSNAVKFTPRGGRITVEARRDGERLALTVRDTGIGVLAAELPRLGSPFYRAASGQGLPEGGHGLGLSVVRGLVGLHQGRIDIASAPGDGTRVTVSLPLRTQRGRRNASLSATLPQRPIHGALALKTG